MSLPSFWEEWVKELGSWELHDEEDPSALELSEHLLAITPFNGDAMKTNKMLDSRRMEVAMARCGIMVLNDPRWADIVVLIVWLLTPIFKLRKIIRYNFLIRLSNYSLNLKMLSKKH